MGKVSIGLRGWRFDEEAVFDDEGNFRPAREVDSDTRHRLARIAALIEKPCDACWLIHGDQHVKRCNPAEVVYGEPLAEVLLCAAHEPDFYYWYREAGGADHAGTDEFQDAFHEWFADGGRAPEGYGGVEHVETEPADVPKPRVPSKEELTVDVPESEQARANLRDLELTEAYLSDPEDGEHEEHESGRSGRSGRSGDGDDRGRGDGTRRPER